MLMNKDIQPILNYLILVYYYIYYISVNIIQIALCVIYLLNEFIIRVSGNNYRQWDNY